MKTPPEATRTNVGITVKTAGLSWLITTATLLIFTLVIIPQQKATFLENLESKARGITASLQDVTAGAIVSEDYSSVVDHARNVLEGDPSIAFLVITKNDGFGLINEAGVAPAVTPGVKPPAPSWRMETLDASWAPAARTARGGIAVPSPLNRRVFHYSRPFDYSGIEWGWIHVGLALDSYNHSVHAVYVRTALLAGLCMLLGLVASVLYARRLTTPLLRLRETAQQVAAGSLGARAVVHSGDEVEALANTFNVMAQTIQDREQRMRDQQGELQLQTRLQEILMEISSTYISLPLDQLDQAIETSLGDLGRFVRADRAHLFAYEDDKQICRNTHEWCAEGIEPQIQSLQAVPIATISDWVDAHRRGQAIHIPDVFALPPEDGVRQVLEPQGVKSLLSVPMIDESHCLGFIGFDSVQQQHSYSAAEQRLLTVFAQMLVNIRQRIKTEHALMISRHAAEQASRTKSEFLANMSHELRTPLNHIIGFTELVLSSDFGKLSAEQEEFLKDVLGSGHHLLSLINDVLDLAKVEAGKMELEIAPVRIRELLENSLVMVKEKALKHQLQLKVDVHGLPEEVLVDERKLKQVIYNLLSNAVKFTPQGGQVRLEARIQAGSELDGCPVTVAGNGHGQWLSVWVADTGIGLAPEDLARVFSPFEQVEGSASRKYQGTGLGLSLTRQMVALHGGAIWAESAGTGQGSTFRFAIPLPEAPAAGSERSDPINH
ncbi:MAG: ATP-binding protein [Deltaproteobacteria bacterium]|nr:ATP-binding protein [Deltaproteobacteria bacterium]